MTTKNLIPRADGEGGIGIDGAAWASGVFNTGFFADSVGIGTTSPLAPLEIRGARPAIRLNDDDPAGQSNFEIVNNGGNFAIFDANVPQGNLFQINGASRNVGIGTNDPDELLHIANSGGGASLLIETNNSFGGNVLFGDDTSKTLGRIQYLHSDNSMRLSTSGSNSPNMLIDSAGNVGIGTTTPMGKLSIEGSTATDYSTHLVFNNTAGSKDFAIGAGIHSSTNQGFGIIDTNTDEPFLYIKDDGNVGIGTKSPVTLLDINAPKNDANGNPLNNDVLMSFSKGDAGEARIGLAGMTSQVLAGALTNDLCIRSDGNNIRFGTASATRTDMTIDSAGNVGIGTKEPKRDLNVAGNFRIEKTAVDGSHIGLDFNVGGGADHPELNIYDKDGNAGVFTIKNQNVGIGTTQPNSKLSVTSPSVSDGTDLSPEKTLTLSRKQGGAGYPYGQHANFFMSRFEGTDTAGITSQSRTELNIALTHSHGENGELSDVDGTNEREGGTSVLKLRSDGVVKMKGPLMVGEATIKTSPNNPESIYFQAIPQVKDSEGNAVTVLTADKLGLGTTAVLESAEQDLQFKLLTDQQRFVVGTTGDYGLESGWYRFNDFKVKGATDIGAHPINPVDTRIYADESSFVLFKTDNAGNKVAHLVGGDEEVSSSNALALGIAVKVDSTENPEDIEFVHTDGESYSVINGNSDSLGTNGLPIRQGFQPPSLGSNPAPLLIDGGSF